MDTVLGDSAFVHFAETIERLMDEGIINKGDPAPIVLEFWTAAHGVAALMIAKPYLFVDDNFDLAERVLTAVSIGRVTKDLIGGDTGPEAIRKFVAEQRSERGSG